MTDPTIKQVKFAEQLGITDAMSKTKEELSKLINEKTGGQQKSASGGSYQAKETIVKEIKDKPHSYEFGPAGSRFKIYFNTLGELADIIASINHDREAFNLTEPVKTIKPEEFEG